MIDRLYLSYGLVCAPQFDRYKLRKISNCMCTREYLVSLQGFLAGIALDNLAMKEQKPIKLVSKLKKVLEKREYQCAIKEVDT